MNESDDTMRADEVPPQAEAVPCGFLSRIAIPHLCGRFSMLTVLALLAVVGCNSKDESPEKEKTEQAYPDREPSEQDLLRNL